MKFENNVFSRLKYSIDFENVIFQTMLFWENNISERWHFESMRFCMHLFHFADFFFRYSARALYRSHAKTLTCFVKMEYLKRCIVSYYPRLYDASKRRVKFSRESCSNLVRIYWIYVVLVISEIGAVSVLFTVAVIKVNIEWWEIWLKYDGFSCRC